MTDGEARSTQTVEMRANAEAWLGVRGVVPGTSAGWKPAFQPTWRDVERLARDVITLVGMVETAHEDGANGLLDAINRV